MSARRTYLPRLVESRDLALQATGVAALMVLVLVLIGFLMESWPESTPSYVGSEREISWPTITDPLSDRAYGKSTAGQAKEQAETIATRLAMPRDDVEE